MKTKKILSTVVWLAAISWVCQWTCNNLPGRDDALTEKRDSVCKSQQDSLINNIQNDVFVCLEKDDEKSFTWTKVLESVTDPYHTILEFPIEQLFQKYWENKQLSHPLYVSWVARRIRSLLWTWWIEASDVPQSLNPRSEAITSETRYEIWDTLRVRLIDTDLLEYFPENLNDQLKEEGFETFFDKDSLLIKRLNRKDILQPILLPGKLDSIIVQKWLEQLKEGSFGTLINKDSLQLKKQIIRDTSQTVIREKPDSIAFQKWENLNREESIDYVYDIVVKTLHSGESAWALYRNGKLFMTFKVSVWVPGHSTKTWQFEVQRTNAYVRSAKYGNSPMPYALQYSWPYYLHQWIVDWHPKSHWCVRVEWLKQWVMYSSVKDKKHVDVYIDKKLTQQKKQKVYLRQKK